MSLFATYQNKYRIVSDINEHLPILFSYARQCVSITECGVRTPTSSYAFAAGLKCTEGNSFRMIDIDKSALIDMFLTECRIEGVFASFEEASDLECPLKETDLLFIDTWHVYGHLKRELAYWHGHVKKFIILHDTTVDEVNGETLRLGDDPVKQSVASGIPVEEIIRGLGPAVTEFLADHPEWMLEAKYTHNNGLTILRRRS